MEKAQLVFTRYPKSFSVHVKNLEELTVEQIQVLESFVRNRKGIFDFNTYTFAIQKKLEFDEFVKLIESSSIEAICHEEKLKEKHKAKVEFGKYKGMFYSELPDSYLHWLKANYKGKDRDIIDEELSFRAL